MEDIKQTIAKGLRALADKFADAPDVKQTTFEDDAKEIAKEVCEKGKRLFDALAERFK